MFLFECDRLSESYPDLLRQIHIHGDEVESRAGLTKEIAPAVISLTDPTHCIPERDKYSMDLLAVEVTMLLAGKFDERLLAMASEKAAELITPAVAYGPRIKRQMIEVEAELREDPSSRRAVVYIGQGTDLTSAKRDVTLTAGQMPCTCLWQFLVRNDTLNMVVYMRSNDAVWGLSYDIPCFVGAQMAMAHVLNIPVGSYTHIAGSLHLYEKHFDLESGSGGKQLHLAFLDENVQTMEDVQVIADRAMWRWQNGISSEAAVI